MRFESLEDILDMELFSESGDPRDHFNDDNPSWKNSSIDIPDGGYSEKPRAKPYDATSIKTSSGIQITADAYNDAFNKLKQSFKEGLEVMEMIEGAEIIENSLEDQQEAYTESMVWNAIYESYLTGPMYEAVKAEDKAEISKIVKEISAGVEKTVKENKLHFYKPYYMFKILASLGIIMAAGIS